MRIDVIQRAGKPKKTNGWMIFANHNPDALRPYGEEQNRMKHIAEEIWCSHTLVIRLILTSTACVAYCRISEESRTASSCIQWYDFKWTRFQNQVNCYAKKVKLQRSHSNKKRWIYKTPMKGNKAFLRISENTSIITNEFLHVTCPSYGKDS